MPPPQLESAPREEPEEESTPPPPPQLESAPSPEPELERAPSEEPEDESTPPPPPQLERAPSLPIPIRQELADPVTLADVAHDAQVGRLDDDVGAQPYPLADLDDLFETATDNGLSELSVDRPVDALEMPPRLRGRDHGDNDDNDDDRQFIDLSDLDIEPGLVLGPDDSEDDVPHEELVLDSDDEDYDAGRVESADEDEDDLEAAEAIAADLLEQLDIDNELEPEADAGIDYKNPLQILDKQDLVNIGWCQLSRSLPQKKVPIHRDFWHAAGAPKASDQRTARQRLAELTGIGLVRFECCPESHVCYEDPRYKNLTACPKKGCGIPRWTGRTRVIRGRKRHGEDDVVIRVRDASCALLSRYAVVAVVG